MRDPPTVEGDSSRWGMPRCQDVRVRVLLSDGSGVTSRQVALLLGHAGHEVEVFGAVGGPAQVRPAPNVARAHPAPAFAADPWGWLDALEATVRTEGHDVVVPFGAHAAVVSRSGAETGALKGRIAVPRYPALERVLDKVSAAATLTEIGLPQPETLVVRSAEALRQAADPPLYVKRPVGAPATRIRLREELLRLADELDADGAFADRGRVLLQHPAQGPLVTAQSVFDNGRLVAVHAYQHLTPGGTAKQGLALPLINEHITLLGAHIGWHGALSMDGVLTADGPVWIGVDPYLTDPTNAARSGVDLVGAFLAVARGEAPAAQKPGEPDVHTHQFAGALREAARSGRLAVLRELWNATFRRGAYHHSTEELLSPLAEPRAIPAFLALCTTLLAAPGWSLARAQRTPPAHALAPSTWHQIRAGAPPKALPTPSAT